MPYIPGDNAGPLVQQLTLSVPNLSWVQSTIRGVIAYLTSPFSWNDAQDFTGQQAADLFQAILDTWSVGPMTIGQISWFTQDNMEFVDRDPAGANTNLLPCDGRSLSTSAYPVLFSLIAYAFGGSGSSFNLPDLRGRAPIGVGQGSGLSNWAVGDNPGEETHTLSLGEIPAHSHTESGAASSVAETPVVPLPSAVAVPSVTGLAGGSGAHNNIQPSLALYAYIQVF